MNRKNAGCIPSHSLGKRSLSPQTAPIERWLGREVRSFGPTNSTSGAYLGESRRFKAPKGPSKPVICQDLLTPGRYTGVQNGVLRS